MDPNATLQAIRQLVNQALAGPDGLDEQHVELAVQVEYLDDCEQ